MGRTILKILLIILTCGNVFAENAAPSYLKGKYEVRIIYGQNEERIIPLQILERRPMVPTLDGNFIYTDGIYCSSDGDYLEGLCRFEDRAGGMWEMRFSGEPSSKEGYSIFTVSFCREEKRLQQIDFVFKGKSCEVMNMGITPFCINGMLDIKNRQFSICLTAN